jgi:2-C-methyl-D-erythritol 4-phosphate cytidylyltransferase
VQFVIVLAAGSGVRFGGSALPKQLVEVGGKPLFIHSVDTYRGMAEIDRIYLVVNPKYAERFAKIIDQWGYGDRLVTVPGGATRQESIRNALDVIDLTDGLVVLQNAASPLTSVALIRECLAAARSHGAVVAYYPAYHTIFEVADDKLGTLLAREALGYTCDPTVYRLSVLRAALAEQESRGGLHRETTISIVREMGIPIFLIRSPYDNIKVTIPTDVAAVEAIIRERLS